EVFEDKKQRERWLGITQAFASVGGLFVTSINLWIISHGKDLPHLGLPLLNNATDPSSWRYLLMTGFFPAIPIALMLPFVPESKVWRERRASGTMKRPSFGALFSPELRRTTLVTAALSACAYGIAFGALQLTPLRISPGLPEVADHGKAMGPLRAEAAKLSEAFVAAPADSPERAELLTKLKENRAAQEPHDKAIKQVGSKIQLAQEFGGLTGRILLAVLLVVAITRRSLLRLFVLPGLIVAPLTYFYLFHQGATAFSFGMALCGLLVVAQFSYFGEFLPKVFPIHLRGTGGSFATNVGGRMIGTSMAFVTSTMVAPMISGDPARVLPMHIAKAAGIVAVTMFGIAFLLSFFLPEPKEEAAKE
ncbi:MAG: MFS transporter, partial [Verrucomicrobiales bacterium]|nr:MFS transporter [Verrucomicrobiales bacterium]